MSGRGRKGSNDRDSESDDGGGHTHIKAQNAHIQLAAHLMQQRKNCTHHQSSPIITNIQHHY